MKPKQLVLHIILFILTVISTYYTLGAMYSACIMTILLSHEMGHYITSRRLGISTSLPYFLPFPFSLFGTFGAVIRMKGSINSRNALFDMGVAGPLCGFILCIPCVFIGVALSYAAKVTASPMDSISLGEPLLMKLAQMIVIGELPPGYDLVLHPIGFAGWAGLFVTALNLLPVGQLDGGHVIYAIFGEKSKYFYRGSIPVLVFFAIFYYTGWLVLVVLLLVFGIRHPKPLDPHTPLTGKRRLVAGATLLVFVLSFVPAPVAHMSLIELLHLNEPQKQKKIDPKRMEQQRMNNGRPIEIPEGLKRRSRNPLQPVYDSATHPDNNRISNQ